MWEITVKWRKRKVVINSSKILIDDDHVTIHPGQEFEQKIESIHIINIQRCK